MTLNQATKQLRLHKLVIATAVLACGVAAMFGSFVQTPEYRTTETFIVIQDQRFTDPYAQARSADYLANILARIVDTDSFRQAVFTQVPGVRSLLPQAQDDVRTEWEQSIEVKTVAETGIVQVSAFHVSPEAATQLVNAIGQTLTTQAGTYVGENAAVTLLEIDGPVTSPFPVRPNVVLNTLAGALVGLIAVSGLVLVRGRSYIPVTPVSTTPVSTKTPPVRPRSAPQFVRSS